LQQATAPDNTAIADEDSRDQDCLISDTGARTNVATRANLAMFADGSAGSDDAMRTDPGAFRHGGSGIDYRRGMNTGGMAHSRMKQLGCASKRQSRVGDYEYIARIIIYMIGAEEHSASPGCRQGSQLFRIPNETKLGLTGSVQAGNGVYRVIRVTAQFRAQVSGKFGERDGHHCGAFLPSFLRILSVMSVFWLA
jgi:hypothetical protein